MSIGIKREHTRMTVDTAKAKAAEREFGVRGEEAFDVFFVFLREESTGRVYERTAYL